MTERGHRGVSFRQSLLGNGAIGEISLEPNSRGEWGIFISGAGGNLLTGTKEAFDKIRAGDEEGGVAQIRALYEDVEVKWIPATESLINIAQRPQEFDTR